MKSRWACFCLGGPVFTHTQTHTHNCFFFSVQTCDSFMICVCCFLLRIFECHLVVCMGSRFSGLRSFGDPPDAQLGDFVHSWELCVANLCICVVIVSPLGLGVVCRYW